MFYNQKKSQQQQWHGQHLSPLVFSTLPEPRLHASHKVEQLILFTHVLHIQQQSRKFLT